jgi:hypothetical protein
MYPLIKKCFQTRWKGLLYSILIHTLEIFIKYRNNSLILLNPRFKSNTKIARLLFGFLCINRVLSLGLGSKGRLWMRDCKIVKSPPSNRMKQKLSYEWQYLQISFFLFSLFMGIIGVLWHIIQLKYTGRNNNTKTTNNNGVSDDEIWTLLFGFLIGFEFWSIPKKASFCWKCCFVK